MHYKLFLTFEPADEIRKASLKCHHTFKGKLSLNYAVHFINVYAANPTLFPLSVSLRGFMQFRPVPGIVL